MQRTGTTTWIERRHRIVAGLAGRLPFPAVPAPRAIVAIPVRNEADRIEACLSALLAQRDPGGRRRPAGSFGIVLLVNNADDGTAALARARLADSGVPHLIAEVDLPAPFANAGFARGVALELAAQWLERGAGDGILLTTDADSRVPPGWVAHCRALIGRTCSAVAGTVRLDPLETARLPASLRQRQVLEQAYEAALLELCGRLDPRPDDPWPNHWGAFGANYALALSAYRRIGGLPTLSHGEDRALTLALEQHDLVVRHDPDLVVTTSARLQGQARGGVAEALSFRCANPDAPGDRTLEPIQDAVRRCLWRAHLRAWHGAGSHASQRWLAPLRLPDSAADWLQQPHFGALWHDIERASPVLRHRPLRPSAMPAHTMLARRLIDGLDAIRLEPAAGHRAGSAACGPEPASSSCPVPAAR